MHFLVMSLADLVLVTQSFYDGSMTAISVDPDVQGGTPCFSGTRVPVRSLFDALARGRTVDIFSTAVSSVRAEQVNSVLGSK